MWLRKTVGFQVSMSEGFSPDSIVIISSANTEGYICCSCLLWIEKARAKDKTYEWGSTYIYFVWCFYYSRIKKCEIQGKNVTLSFVYSPPPFFFLIISEQPTLSEVEGLAKNSWKLIILEHLVKVDHIADCEWHPPKLRVSARYRRFLLCRPSKSKYSRCCSSVSSTPLDDLTSVPSPYK